jgi:hypothetical protein
MMSEASAQIDQFGPRAAAYVGSAVHARVPTLRG